MKLSKSFPDRLALVAALTLAATTADRAVAQPSETQRIDDLEKENAAMRTRIRRLEAETENTRLHARLEQLQTGRQPAPREASPTPRVEASAPDRTLIMADMSLKAPAPLAPRLYSWTGFYAGGNVGYGVASDRAMGTLTNPTASGTSADGSFIAPVGAIGGVQLGYNWQGGPNWLVGFEADVQGSAQKGISCVVGCINAPAFNNVQDITIQHKLDYFGTVRGRVGVVNNNATFYVTAGGAYGRIEQTLVQKSVLGGPGNFDTIATRENKFGYVVGAGAEAALGGNWTGKVEYLFMDLGSTASTLNGVIGGATPYSVTATSTIRDNIVRAGLNYRFGDEARPVATYDAMASMTAGAPVHAWTGFYVGGNVGYGIGNNRVAQNEVSLAISATSEPNTAVMPKGIVGGAQLGYNWQPGAHWLVGFEADFQASSQNDRACGPLICLVQTASGSTGTNAFAVEHQLDYFGTARGRLGAVNGNLLYYVTGGAAFAHVRQTVEANVSLSTPPIFSSNGTTADMIGWVAGGGIEMALWDGWSTKAEYLYMDLGSLSTALDVSTPSNPATLTTTSTIRDHIVRVGTNYRF